MAIDPNCPRCRGIGWTCEVHLDEPMDHDGCSAFGEPCELCCPAGQLPELPPGFVPSFAIDLLLDRARSLPALTATARMTTPVAVQAADTADPADAQQEGTEGHPRRRHD